MESNDGKATRLASVKKGKKKGQTNISPFSSPIAFLIPYCLSYLSQHPISFFSMMMTSSFSLLCIGV